MAKMPLYALFSCLFLYDSPINSNCWLGPTPPTPCTHTRPARSPVNASPSLSRPKAHDSGPMWLAMPSLYDSFIHYTSPVLTGAFTTSLCLFLCPRRYACIWKGPAFLWMILNLKAKGQLFVFILAWQSFDYLLRMYYIVNKSRIS